MTRWSYDTETGELRLGGSAVACFLDEHGNSIARDAQGTDKLGRRIADTMNARDKAPYLAALRTIASKPCDTCRACSGGSTKGCSHSEIARAALES